MLSKTHLDDDEVMEVDKSLASKIFPSHEWLLDLLPTIPMFTKVGEHITNFIRQVNTFLKENSSKGFYQVYFFYDLFHRNPLIIIYKYILCSIFAGDPNRDRLIIDQCLHYISIQLCYTPLYRGHQSEGDTTVG